MFNVLRQMEHWLHQHIFKVGWLFTKDFQVTTILYYTFLLPGILLYEITYWLSAGILNVHAERSIRWPEKQEIGELRLNFVKLSKKASPLKVAIINITPLFAGLIIVWFIASGIFNLSSVLDHFDTNTTLLRASTDAINEIISVPDFWLWAWVTFAVSNTMLPDQNILRRWWWIIGIICLGMIPLFFIEIGDETVGDTVIEPIIGGLNAISTAFGLTVFIDVCAVAILGLIESLTEYVTGNSATFKNGKMIVMTREAAVALHKQEQQKERAKLQQKRQNQPVALPQGPPSIYRISLPIPGEPGQEPITQSATSILMPKSKGDSTSKPARPIREEPDTIVSEAFKPTPPLESSPHNGDIDDTSTETNLEPEESLEDAEENL